MTPTNHLRWKSHERKVPYSPGVYGDFRSRTEVYQVLEQFWEIDMLTALKDTPPSWDESVQKFGEWKPLPEVK